MKLFKVVSTKTGNDIQVGFSNKIDAKVERNKLNEKFNKDRKPDDPFQTFKFIIMRDKDHRLGASPKLKKSWLQYNKPLAIMVTKETREFYRNKRKKKQPKLIIS